MNGADFGENSLTKYAPESDLLTLLIRPGRSKTGVTVKETLVFSVDFEAHRAESREV